MSQPNREWQTFGRRWSQTRFDKFLCCSVAGHVLLAVLVGVPAHLAHKEKQALKLEQQRQEAEQRREQEQAVQEAEAELRDLLTEELAAEQLREFYEGLIGDLLDEELADHYWDALLEELGTQLDELAELFDDAEAFDQKQVEELVQDLKLELLDELAQMLHRDHQRSLMDELLAQARELARRLAEIYRQELAKRVGHPIGDNLRKVVEQEESGALARLTQAERELAYATREVENAEKALEKAQASLSGHRDALKAAEEQKDASGENTARLGTRKQKAPLDAAAGSLDKGRARAKSAAQHLAWHMPRAQKELQEADGQHAAPAREGAAAAAREAGKGDPAEAGRHAEAGLAHARGTLAALERVRTAVGLRTASEMANRLSRDTAEHARSASQLGEQKRTAERGEDGKALARVVRDLSSAARRVDRTAQAVSRLENRLQEVEKSGKGVPKEEYEPSLAAAQSDLTSGRKSLSAQSGEHASQSFQEAASKLDRVSRAIGAAQRRLGFGEKTVGESILREVNELREGKLNQHVRGKFDELYRQRALPVILKRVGESTEKRLRAERVFSAAFQNELAKELSRIFGENVPAHVAAGKRFAETAGEKLPPERKRAGEKEGEHGERAHKAVSQARVTEIKGGAEKAGTRLADRNLPGVVDAGLRGRELSLFGQRHSEEHEGADRGSLLARLGNLRNQVAAGRDDFLGRPGRTGLAAARRRHIDRKGSARRFRGVGDIDVAAYRRIIERIKDRGQIVGQEYDLKGAEGEASAAQSEKLIRPAMVCLPELPPDRPQPEPQKRREVPKPEFQTSRFTGIPFLPDDAIQVDGDLSDWKTLPSLQLDVVRKGANAGVTQPKHQKGWVAYCAKGLWVAVDVIDTSGKLENHVGVPAFWLNDCVELFLDTLNTKYSRRGEQHTHQFFGFPFGHKDDPETGGYEAYIDRTGEFERSKRIPYPQSVMPRAGKKTEKGWTFEMLVPKKLLRIGEIKPGRIIGFNLQLDTGSDLYYYWTCAERIISSMHPNTWGDIQFLGSDAKIEIVGEDGKETVQSILPGQPIRVRITDPDMNLDDRQKDKVSVSLRTSAGDLETLILEETGRQSGVFLNTLATGLNIGSASPGVLELFEGEKVVAEYVDQAQAYGERDVPVKAEFRVCSIGTKLAKK